MTRVWRVTANTGPPGSCVGAGVAVGQAVHSTFLLGAFALVSLGCGAVLPGPEVRPHVASNYEQVPYPPPSALVEVVPPRSKDAVWVDGFWVWAGRFFVWERGGWFAPDEGVYVSPWSAKYEEDGRLTYAPTVWHAPDGSRIESPEPVAPAGAPPRAQTPEPATVP